MTRPGHAGTDAFLGGARVIDCMHRYPGRVGQAYEVTDVDERDVIDENRCRDCEAALVPQRERGETRNVGLV